MVGPVTKRQETYSLAHTRANAKTSFLIPRLARSRPSVSSGMPARRRRYIDQLSTATYEGFTESPTFGANSAGTARSCSPDDRLRGHTENRDAYQFVDKIFTCRSLRNNWSMFAMQMMMTRPAGDRRARMCS